MVWYLGLLLGQKGGAVWWGAWRDT